MPLFLRKKLWNQFYVLVITEVMISKEIKSQTLKNMFSDISGTNLYTSLVVDLKLFFESANLDYLLDISAHIVEEQHSKNIAQKFIATVLTSV